MTTPHHDTTCNHQAIAPWRKTRPWRRWTCQEQSTAEVAAACGVSYREIADALGRDRSVVLRHLRPALAEKNRLLIAQSHRENPELHYERLREWQALDRARVKARQESQATNPKSKPGPRRRSYGERRPISPRLRFLVLSAAGFRCQLCGSTPGDGIVLQVDHVIPFAQGGDETLGNLQALCNLCNVGKGADLHHPNAA